MSESISDRLFSDQGQGRLTVSWESTLTGTWNSVVVASNPVREIGACTGALLFAEANKYVGMLR